MVCRRTAASAVFILVAAAVASAFTLLLDTVESPGADVVLGQPDSTSSSADSALTSMDDPQDVAVDSSGVVYVADAGNDRVLVFTSLADTVPDTVIGGATDGVGADRLDRPAALALWQGVETTVLFVSDENNNRILAYLVRTGGGSTVLADTVADYVFGQPSFDTNVADNDGDGGSSVSESGLQAPAGLDVEDTGASYVTLWACDKANDRIVGYTLAKASFGSASIDTTADRLLGQDDFQGSGGGTNEQEVNGPADIAVRGGRIFIADAGNHRVVVESTGDATFDAVYGQPSFTASAAGFSETALNAPSAVAVSADGRTMAIADATNNRIVLHDDTTGADTCADDAIGDSDLVTDAFVATGVDSRALSAPSGLWFENASRLWVADAGNNRVLAFDGTAVEPAAGLTTQGAISVTSSASVTVPVVAATSESFVLVALSGGGTTAAPAAAADSSGTGADYTLVVPLGDGNRRDTATIYLWTSLETGAVYVGLRTDTSSLDVTRLPAGLRASTETALEAFRSTAIFLEFGDEDGDLLGTTSTTTDVSSLYAYTIVYDLGTATTARFASLGFDTSAGSIAFKFWYADTWAATYVQDTPIVTVTAGGSRMRIVVERIGRDLPGALGLNDPGGVTGAGGGGVCLVERLGAPGGLLAALRAWRDHLLEVATGRLLAALYYSFTS